MSCGQCMGHGLYCEEGMECGSCQEIRELKLFIQKVADCETICQVCLEGVPTSVWAVIDEAKEIVKKPIDVGNLKDKITKEFINSATDSIQREEDGHLI